MSVMLSSMLVTLRSEREASDTGATVWRENKNCLTPGAHNEEEQVKRVKSRSTHTLIKLTRFTHASRDSLYDRLGVTTLAKGEQRYYLLSWESVTAWRGITHTYH